MAAALGLSVAAKTAQAASAATVRLQYCPLFKRFRLRLVTGFLFPENTPFADRDFRLLKRQVYSTQTAPGGSIRRPGWRLVKLSSWAIVRRYVGLK